MAVLADFRARYPEFDTTTDERVQVFLDDAALEMSESVWNTLYDRGQLALTAHLLTLSNKTATGATGPSSAVTGRSVGDVSVSFGTAAVKDKQDEYLSSTSYGQEYLRLGSLLGGFVLTV